MTLKDPPHRRAKKKLVWILIKVTIGLGLLAVLVWMIGPRKLLHRLTQISPWSYLFALAVYAVGMSIRTIRWRLLLRAIDVPQRLAYLIKLQFIGVFFNQFIPTSLGGDGIRVLYLYREGVAWEKGIGSVLVERVVGMLMLIVLGLISGVSGYHIYRDSRILWVLVAFGVALVAGILVLLSERVARRFLSLLGRLKLSRLRSVFERFSLGMRAYRAHPWTLLAVTALSLAFQFVVIWLFYFFSRALGMAVPFSYFLLFVPILIAVSQVPISPSGLGVRELASVLLFTQEGIAAEASQAVALGMCYWALHFGVGVLGGLFFMLSGGRDRKLMDDLAEELEAEEEFQQDAAPTTLPDN